MGKNRQGKKPAKVKAGLGQLKGVKGTHKAFKVSAPKVTKSKNKTKAVTTNLKRLNLQNRQQVSQSDSAFTKLQKDMKTKTHKEKSKAPAKTSQKSTTTKDAAVPNVDEAMKQMACL